MIYIVFNFFLIMGKKEEFLAGYKTYVSGGMVILATVLFMAGLIDYETFVALVTLFGGAGMVALRKGIKKAETNRVFGGTSVSDPNGSSAGDVLTADLIADAIMKMESKTKSKMKSNKQSK